MWPFVPLLPPRFEAALRDVRSADPYFRLCAAERLGDLSESDGVSDARNQALLALNSLLADPCPEVRAAAICSLGQLRAHDSLDLILERLESELQSEDGVSEAAVIAAGKIGGGRAKEAVSRLCHHPRPTLRASAVWAYALLAPEEARPLIALALHDEAQCVRLSAIEALALLEPTEEAKERLARLLHDEDEAVVEESALALAQMGDKRAIPVLVRMLRNSLRPFEVLAGLGELRAQEAIPLIEAIGRSPLRSLLLRAAASAALIRIGSPNGKALFEKCFRAWRTHARTYCVNLIGELGLVEYVPDLVRMIERPKGADRAAILSALFKLSSKSEQARLAYAQACARSDWIGKLAREIGQKSEAKAPPPSPRFFLA
ncbi:MAG: HEAT repeat domain-containing protein [Sandaracinaceae bacterium]|nr:HEAT repeat domain-containing protein [Sandaracinaceae bacterium]